MENPPPGAIPSPPRSTNILSTGAYQFTARHEGLKLKAYQDGGGVWTIGYGHTQNVKAGDVCTPVQATLWLQGELEGRIRYVLSRYPDLTGLQPYQLAAIADAAFNAGAEAVCNAAWLKYIRSKSFNAFVLWRDWYIRDAHGIVEPGLPVRRLDEIQLFIYAKY